MIPNKNHGRWTEHAPPAPWTRPGHDRAHRGIPPLRITVFGGCKPQMQATPGLTGAGHGLQVRSAPCYHARICAHPRNQPYPTRATSMTDARQRFSLKQAVHANDPKVAVDFLAQHAGLSKAAVKDAMNKGAAWLFVQWATSPTR